MNKISLALACFCPWIAAGVCLVVADLRTAIQVTGLLLFMVWPFVVMTTYLIVRVEIQRAARAAIAEATS
jgi:hypothetical protein